MAPTLSAWLLETPVTAPSLVEQAAVVGATPAPTQHMDQVLAEPEVTAASSWSRLSPLAAVVAAVLNPARLLER